jgi:hypothetical protein
VLLSPFGDSISPLNHYSQLVVGTVESFYTEAQSWMRLKLYLTQDRKFFDWVFLNGDDPDQTQYWYWIDSLPSGTINNVYGPFDTTLHVPKPAFFSEKGALWGNTYPLMSTGPSHPGIDCNHWVVPTRGAPDHGSWYALRRDTGTLFRIFMMDSTNPLMIPILGSYYIANLPTFTANVVSDQSRALIQRIQTGAVAARAGYWNPLVTQEDIHRAMAFPLSTATCTIQEIQTVLPGFTPVPSGVQLPSWNHKTYIEAWTLGQDLLPYFTRVCYLWTGDANSKQQTVFIGLGADTGQGSYLKRTDTCLNTVHTDQPYYEWQGGSNTWAFNRCLGPNPPVGLPYPDWVERDHGVVMGQIIGNPNFGLGSGEALNLIAAELPR